MALTSTPLHLRFDSNLAAQTKPQQKQPSLRLTPTELSKISRDRQKSRVRHYVGGEKNVNARSSVFLTIVTSTRPLAFHADLNQMSSRARLLFSTRPPAGLESVGAISPLPIFGALVPRFDCIARSLRRYRLERRCGRPRWRWRSRGRWGHCGRRPLTPQRRGSIPIC